MSNKLITIVIIVWVVIAACAEAQEPATSTAATETAAATTTAAEPVPAPTNDVEETRAALREVLHRLPPEVGRVLKIDTSLWSNKSYVDNYPGLAAFVAKHPEVARNPQFYTRGIWIQVDEAPPETSSVRLWRDLMEGFFVLFGVSMTIFIFTWLVRRVIEHRHWTRLARVQAEVHNKLLDRFGSNEDVLKYIESPSGKKFLEAAPIPLDAEPRAVSAPISRVLWSVQIGVILAFGGLGLRLVSYNVEKEVSSALGALGTLALAIGIGFIVSALISFFVSRRLGIWRPVAEAHE